MTKQELENLKTSARITALENLVAVFLAAYARGTGAEDILVGKMKEYNAEIGQVAMKGMSPEESDLYAAELQEAVKGLTELVIHIVKRKA